MVYGTASNSLCIASLLYDKHQNINSPIHILFHLINKDLFKTYYVVSTLRIKINKMCMVPVLKELIGEETSGAEERGGEGRGGETGGERRLERSVWSHIKYIATQIIDAF